MKTDDDWGTPRRESLFWKEQRISDAKKTEIKMMNELNNNSRKFKVQRYESFDESGKETAQVIKTRYGTVRCLDLYVDDIRDVFEESILRIEIKTQFMFYKKKYVKVEADVFEDYLKVQSSEEIEGRIIFIVDENGQKYWQRLSYLDSLKEREKITEGRYVGLFYIWDIGLLKKYRSPDDFFSDVY